MITFVGNDAKGLPLKRKQSQRACQSCRKRKKRCLHMSDTRILQSNTTDASPTLQTSALAEEQEIPQCSGLDANTPPIAIQTDSPTTVNQETSAATYIRTVDDGEEHHDRNPRFVGELNPEGTFVAAVSQVDTATAAAAASPDEVVGVWVPRKLFNAAKSLSSPILSLLAPYLEDECSRALPMPSHYDAIHDLYVREFHPLLPVIDMEYFQAHQEKPKTILKLALCLCVATNPRAQAHLQQPPIQFTGRVTQLLRSAIDNNLVTDRHLITQLLVILALSTQLSDDRHTSAEYTSRAVTCAQTSGLHLDTSANGRSHNRLTTLFFCVFALDRLNAAVQGRPVLIHARDIGRNLKTCIDQQHGLFQLLLRIVLVLDDVIALYRPAKDVKDTAEERSRDLDTDFPSFEDMLNSCGAIRVAAPLVATVETLYHAVAMLSCRSQSLKEPFRNSPSHVRQSLSSASVISIVGTEFHGQLSILPFVPYAMALALRVSYRDLRLSKSSFTRMRARRQLLHVCSLLREFGVMFSSSIQMVQLAEQTVREMDKAFSSVAAHRPASFAAAGTEHQRSTFRHPHDDECVRLNHIQIVSPTEVAHVADDADLPTFDQTQFDFDLDIFDYFDPDFDIEAIDAAFTSAGVSAAIEDGLR